MNYVTVGEVVNTFGIKGELKVMSYTDFADKRFAKGAKITLTQGKNRVQETIAGYRNHKGMILISFEGKKDINLVEQYVGSLLEVDEDTISPLPEGQYYFRELTGLTVICDGKEIGKVVEVLEGITHANLRIQVGNKKTLVPFVDAFVKNVDLQKGTIVLELIEGML
ncbi:MAG: ribosome maturation factor RimM [Erysipelotrichaceae bacterium]|nr:ribosome maturation factor RimM [Erysipelotrichaceae bacterium]